MKRSPVLNKKVSVVPIISFAFDKKNKNSDSNQNLFYARLQPFATFAEKLDNLDPRYRNLKDGKKLKLLDFCKSFKKCDSYQNSLNVSLQNWGKPEMQLQNYRLKKYNLQI